MGELAYPDRRRVDRIRRLLYACGHEAMIETRAARTNGGSAMADELKLNKPWLVAVWPGMGHVAIQAGYFLVAKLGMHILAEFSALELFDVEHVEVKGGLIRMGRLPRSRFFVWKDPRERHDIVVFIGEAQPPKGRYAFCQRLDRVRAAARDRAGLHVRRDGDADAPRARLPRLRRGHRRESLAELKRLELEILEDGQIGGLNGVLLGVAAESGLRGACLLGEMPHIFAQLPFPKASLAVLEAFSTIANIRDRPDRAVRAGQGGRAQARRAAGEGQGGPGRPATGGRRRGGVGRVRAGRDRGRPRRGRRELIEQLFRQARKNRTKAYELKRELDRLELYREYEDRFLDLFKKPE